MISNSKLKLEKVPIQTSQNNEPPQGIKASIQFVMLLCADRAKLVYKRKSLYRKLIKSHEVGVTKPFENIIT